jgi:hypothetical protein
MFKADSCRQEEPTLSSSARVGTSPLHGHLYGLDPHGEPADAAHGLGSYGEGGD